MDVYIRHINDSMGARAGKVSVEDLCENLNRFEVDLRNEQLADNVRGNTGEVGEVIRQIVYRDGECFAEFVFGSDDDA